MDFILPPQIQGFISNEIAHGRFADEKSLIIAALQNFYETQKEKQRQYDWLQNKLDLSEDDVKNGHVISAKKIEGDYEARWGTKFE